MANDEVRIIDIDDIENDPNNSNVGTDRGNAMVRASYDKFGHLESGVIDKNGRLIGGEKRRAAAKEAGIRRVKVVEIEEGEMLVGQRMDMDVLSPEGMEASQILNRSALVSINIDAAKVRSNITDGMNLSLMYTPREKLKLGYAKEQEDLSDIQDSPDFAALPSEATAANATDAEDTDQDPSPLPSLAESTDEGVPPSLAQYVEGVEFDVQEGDLWQAGDQWFWCGDCTQAGDVARSVHAEPLHICVTSPPYAMQKQRQYGGIPESEYVDWFVPVQDAIHSVLSEQGHFFLNIKPHSENFQRSLYVFDLVLSLVRVHGWRFIDEFCWRHGGIPGDPNKMGKFKNQFEPIYWFTKSVESENGLPYPFYPQHVMVHSDNIVQDDRYQPGVNEYQGQKTTFLNRRIGPGMAYPGNILKGKSNKLYGHEAVFPVNIPAFFIAAFTKEGEWAFDPFGGAGTTAIAAQNLGRKSLIVEIQPKYVEISLKRFQEAFGIMPKRVENV